jgi:predicted alpha/beta superfamily hydrolase
VAGLALGRPRDLLVYLPPGYGEGERRYPVVYAQDGQNLFDAATAFGGQEWELDETAELLVRAGAIPPVIVVGIPNAGLRRIDEYAPTRDARRRAGGQAGAYGHLLLHEVKPFVDRTFRTEPEPHGVCVLGSSMGALVSLFLALRHPHAIGAAVVMSPSVWWDRRVILDVVRAFRGHVRPRVWLDVGTREGRTTTRDVRALRTVLVEGGWRAPRELAYAEYQGARHNESAWGARVGHALRWLLSDVSLQV